MKKLICLVAFVFLNCSSNDYSTPGSVNHGNRLTGFYIRRTCIEGHVYYLNNGYQAGGIASKLHDDGTPVKCEE